MIEFGGVQYVIDLDKLDEILVSTKKGDKEKNVFIEVKTVLDEHNKLVGTETLKTTSDKTKEIDATKFNVLIMMLEELMAYNEEVDDRLGSINALEKTSFSFKLAFNTLFSYGVLKEV